MQLEYIKIEDVFKRELIVKAGSVESGIKVSWIYNNKAIVKSCRREGQLLAAMLTPSKQEIIITFYELEGIDPRYHCAIFNPDGHLRFLINLPDLVSEKYKEYEYKVGKDNAKQNIHFINPAISKKQTGEEVLTMWIGFDYDWFEVRELNPHTGEFGSCLWTSKI